MNHCSLKSARGATIEYLRNVSCLIFYLFDVFSGKNHKPGEPRETTSAKETEDTQEKVVSQVK